MSGAMGIVVLARARGGGREGGYADRWGRLGGRRGRSRLLGIGAAIRSGVLLPRGTVGATIIAAPARRAHGRSSWEPVCDHVPVICRRRSCAVVPEWPAGWRLAVMPDRDRDHRATAAGAWTRSGRDLRHGFCATLCFRHLSSQHHPAGRETGGALAVGEEAEMADAVKAIGHGVKKKAADELSGIKGHRPWPAAMAIVTPTERHLAICHADQT